MYAKDKHSRGSTNKHIWSVHSELPWQYERLNVFYHPPVTSDKLGECTQHALSSCGKSKQYITPSLRSQTCCLTVTCDDRLIFVTDSLHLFPKTACLFLKNAAACLAGGKGKNGKNVVAWSMGNSSIVCNYSHIPKQCSLRHSR